MARTVARVPADDRVVTALAWFTNAWRLKDRPREGWRVRGVADPESVAAHSWGTAQLCLMFADEAGVDRAQAIEIALVHDLAEAEIGDLPSFGDVAERPVPPDEKARLERAAMNDLEASWPEAAARRTSRLWRAYEERDGDAAVFVRDMNLLDMSLQAYLYARDRRGTEATNLAEFFDSADARIATPVGRRRFEEVRAAFRALGSERDG